MSSSSDSTPVLSAPPSPSPDMTFPVDQEHTSGIKLPVTISRRAKGIQDHCDICSDLNGHPLYYNFSVRQKGATRPKRAVTDADDSPKPKAKKQSSLRVNGKSILHRSNVDCEVVQQRQERRRKSHNLIERRRRDTINYTIQQMEMYVPETLLDKSVKPQRCDVLKASLDYIKTPFAMDLEKGGETSYAVSTPTWSALSVSSPFILVPTVLNIAKSVAVDVASYWCGKAIARIMRPANPHGYFSHLMSVSSNFFQYEEAARILDELENNEAWKRDPRSPDYDWELVLARLRQLRKARKDGDLRDMIFLLRTSLERNLGDMGNPKLYAHTHIGTKDLITDYIDEVILQLNIICDADPNTPYHTPTSIVPHYAHERMYSDPANVQARQHKWRHLVTTANPLPPESHVSVHLVDPEYVEDDRRTSIRPAQVCDSASQYKAGQFDKDTGNAQDNKQTVVQIDDDTESEKPAQTAESMQERPLPNQKNDILTTLKAEDATMERTESSSRGIEDMQQDGLDLKAKYELFLNLRQNFGRTALLLSGGATFGLNHIGVLKTLFEADLLPRIISGASSGSIVASLACTRTDDELESLFHPENVYLEMFDKQDSPDSVFTKLERFLKHGVLFEVDVLKETMRANLGDMTFQEAFNRTRRILNITVSSSTRYEMPRLLNYLTAPNVLIWSAVAASCAVPGVFPSSPIYAKDKNGNIFLWNPSDNRWIDGSVENDLPMNKLAELFNVNHFIVCQVNPHVHPFLRKSLKRNRFSDLVRFGMKLTKSELQLRCNQLIELNIAPSFFHRLQAIMSQKYYGDITIVPDIKLADFLRIITNPTPEMFLDACVKGERATWPKMSIIKNHLSIELAIDEIIYRLRLRRLSEGLPLVNRETVATYTPPPWRTANTPGSQSSLFQPNDNQLQPQIVISESLHHRKSNSVNVSVFKWAKVYENGSSSEFDSSDEEDSNTYTFGLAAHEDRFLYASNPSDFIAKMRSSRSSPDMRSELLEDGQVTYQLQRCGSGRGHISPVRSEAYKMAAHEDVRKNEAMVRGREVRLLKNHLMMTRADDKPAEP